MNKELENIIWLTDTEFKGKSFNGYSLISTLEQINAEEAASTDSYEKYSVWGIVLHVMFCKYLLAKHLGADTENLYPYNEDYWPDLPASKTEESWQETIENLKRVHEAYVNALKKNPIEKWSEEFPEWKIPWSKIIYWFPTHYTFHAAQIRNMGIKKYKQAKF